MIYYFLLLAWLATSYFCLYKLIKVRNRKKIFMFLTFISLSFLSCFRDYSVGVDTRQWVDFYSIYGLQGFKAVNFSQPHEPGYVLLNVILWNISSNPRLLIVVCGLFINFAFCYFITKYSKDTFFSVLTFVCFRMYFESLCLLRQFLATALILLFFSLLLNKKYIRFLFVTIIASMFHYFALVFLILIPIHYIGKLNKIQLSVVLILFLICYIFVPQIIEFFLRHVANYGDYIGYLQEEGIVIGEFDFKRFIIIFLAYLMPFVFRQYRYATASYTIKTCMSNQNKRKNCFDFLIIIYLLIACVIVLSFRFSLFERIYAYFMPFILLLPNVVNVDKHKELKVYYILLNIAYFTFFLCSSDLFGTNNFIFFWTNS